MQDPEAIKAKIRADYEAGILSRNTLESPEFKARLNKLLNPTFTQSEINKAFKSPLPTKVDFDQDIQKKPEELLGEVNQILSDNTKVDQSNQSEFDLQENRNVPLLTSTDRLEELGKVELPTGTAKDFLENITREVSTLGGLTKGLAERISQRKVDPDTKLGFAGQVIGDFIGAGAPAGAVAQGTRQILLNSPKILSKFPQIEKILKSDKLFDQFISNAGDGIIYDLGYSAVSATDDEGNFNANDFIKSLGTNTALAGFFGAAFQRAGKVIDNTKFKQDINSDGKNITDNRQSNVGKERLDTGGIPKDSSPQKKTVDEFIKKSQRDKFTDEQIIQDYVVNKSESLRRMTKESSEDIEGLSPEQNQYLKDQTKRFAKQAQDELDEFFKRIDEISPTLKKNYDIPNLTKNITRDDFDYKAFKREEPKAEPPKESVALFGLNADIVNDLPRKIKGAAQKYLTSRGNLPQEVFARKVEMENKTQAIVSNIKFEARQLRSAVKAEFKEKNIDVIDKALKGEIPISDLPPRTARVIEKMRGDIDYLSRRMIKEGIVQGDLAIKVDKNQGVYTTRSYKIHDEPEAWKNYILNNPDGKKIYNKAVSYIRGKLKNKSEDQIQGIISEILDSGDTGSFFRAGKLGSKDLGILKRRSEIPQEIRALMGEYTDPLINYSKSIYKMADLLEKSAFLNDVKKIGMNKFLFESPNSKHFSKIAADQSPTLDPLNGLYTTKEIKEAFEDYFKTTDSGALFKAYTSINGLVKLGKTVGNPMTHARNFVGNSGFAISNGYVNPVKFGRAFKAVSGNLYSNKREWQKLYQRYLDLGVVQESTRGGELRDIIKDVTDAKEGIEKLFDSSIIRLTRQSKKALTEVYQAEDDVWKIFFFENEFARYKKAYPNKTDAEIEKIAAEIVRNNVPTYSLVPKGIKSIRRVPLFGSFVSFPSEVIRTTKNTIMQARKEIANKATREIGLKRLSGIMLAATGTASVVAAGKAYLNISEQEDQDRKRFMPEWDQDGQIVYLNDKTYLNLSYTDPYGYLKNVVGVFFDSEKEIDDKLFDSAIKMLEPFASQEIAAKALNEIAANKKESGAKIYNPEEPVDKRVADALEYFWNKIRPGVLNSTERIGMGIRGEVNRYGRSFNPATEIIATATGQRIVSQDFGESYKFKTFRIAEKIADSRKIYTREHFNQSSKKDTDALSRSKKAMIKNLNEAKKDYDAAVRLGVPQSELNASLTGALKSKFPFTYRKWRAAIVNGYTNKSLDFLIIPKN